tara:strand:- start:1058 stop:2140 length:1083 start_codon:yes stop_codon:yes gene_type:complete
MEIKIKKTLNFVRRIGHWIQDRKQFLTMERNERVDEFPEKIIDEIRKKINSYSLRTYPDDINSIYAKIAVWQKIKKNELIVTQGADGGLLRIFSTFANVGDKVLFLDPSYAMYPVYSKIFKCKPIPLNLDLEFSSKKYFEILKNKIYVSKPKLVLIANPNQPIEVKLDLKHLEKLSKICKKTKSILVIDEAYYHFNSITGKSLIKKFNNVFIVRTFSKAFGLAGLRVGYTISNKKNIETLQTVKPIYEINNINIAIINYFLNKLNLMHDYTLQIKKSRKLIRNRMRKFDSVKLFGKYSNTVLLKLKSKQQMIHIFQALKKNNILVKKGDLNSNIFYLRITLGSVKITRKLINILEKNLYE